MPLCTRQLPILRVSYSAGADVTAPTVVSAAINTAGTSLTLTMSETCVIGAGGNGGLTISPSGGAATLTYSSGSGTSSLVYSINRTILSTETVTRSYTQPGNGIEDSSPAGNDLASFTTQSVTNNSTQTGGTILFQDDFLTGYTWGSLPMTSQSTFNTQAGSNWQYNNDMSASGTGQGGIDVWPADSSKRCFFMKYVQNGDTNVIGHKFDPNFTIDTGRPTDIYVQWKEYRSSNYDAGPTKDWRVDLFTAGHWNDSHDQLACEVYGGWGRELGTETTGVDAVNDTGVFIQGDWNGTDFGAGTVWHQGITLPNATVYKFELHIKVNTPGNHDGALEMWIDGTKLTNSATGIKLTSTTRDALGQSYIDGFQMGMAATNGPSGGPFASITTRFVTDFKIGTAYIG